MNYDPNQIAQQMYQAGWDLMPWWLKLWTLFELWAILCVGICLPLITLKLYWRNIRRYFSEEFHSSPYQRMIEKRQAEEARIRASEKALSKTAPGELSPKETDSTFAEIRERHANAKYLPKS